MPAPAQAQARLQKTAVEWRKERTKRECLERTRAARLLRMGDGGGRLGSARGAVAAVAAQALTGAAAVVR